MRSSIWLSLALLASGCRSATPPASPPAPAGPEAVKSQLQALTREHFDAVPKGDPKLVDLLHPAAIQKIGGREKALSGVKGAANEIQQAKVRFDLKLDEPDVATHQGKTIGFVPYRLTVHVAGSKNDYQGFLLWISEDQGKTWLYVTDAMFLTNDVRKALPELPKDMKVPPVKSMKTE